MKVGDLVRHRDALSRTVRARTGIIIEVGVYVGRKDTLVLWSNGETTTNASTHLKIVNLEEEIDTIALSFAEV
ncbi:hypothetical protein CL634_09955 [bacterium]|nr:hypothetical protein [bacterium]